MGPGRGIARPKNMFTKMGALKVRSVLEFPGECHYMGFSFWLATRVLLYAPSHRQEITYYCLCYTSRGAMAGMRNNVMSDRSLLLLYQFVRAILRNPFQCDVVRTLSRSLTGVT